LLACVIFLFVAEAGAQPARVLYLTTSAGYRHDCLPVSVEALRGVCDRTRLCQLTHTEDASVLTAANLRANYDVVLFYTSGELPISDPQRQELLDFVRTGGSFGGFHSATDTLYSFPAYGEMIGGYFDGHPWTQSARIKNDAPDHPVTRGIPAFWTLTEEFYQFRDFTPDPTAVRVLLSLDTASVDLSAPGVKARAFPLAWVRPYGAGKVFYTALGHFEDTWRNPLFQQLLEEAIAWLSPARPVIAPQGIGNAASLMPANTVSPGSLISIFGRGLAPDARVTLDGVPLPVLYVSATQINALVPPGITSASQLEVWTPAGVDRLPVRFAGVTPGIFAVTTVPGALTLWTTGLGARPESATARVAGLPAEVLYASLHPEFPGLYQVNVAIPAGAPRNGMAQLVELAIGGVTVSTRSVLP